MENILMESAWDACLSIGPDAAAASSAEVCWDQKDTQIM